MEGGENLFFFALVCVLLEWRIRMWISYWCREYGCGIGVVGWDVGCGHAIRGCCVGRPRVREG